jgi:hypothetical protein
MPKKTPAQLNRDIAEVLAKESGSGGPRVLKITGLGSMGGQRAFAVKVQYPGEPVTRIQFVGPSGNMVGPVVMISAKGQQERVYNSGRFGPFNREWVQRFFGPQ